MLYDNPFEKHTQRKITVDHPIASLYDSMCNMRNPL